MLEYYSDYLGGKLWTQNGTKVTRGNQTFNVGDRVKLQVGEAEAVEYTEGGYTWKILGVDKGKLLLVSSTNIGNLYLEGIDGYNNGIEKLNNMCNDYLNETYADEARSIKVEDINRITEFKQNSYSGYGASQTYSSDFEHPKKRNSKLNKSNHRNKHILFLYNK